MGSVKNQLVDDDKCGGCGAYAIDCLCHDDLDIDKCVACGRYFEWDQYHRELVIARDGDRRPHAQECHPCLRGVPPPHEY